MSVREGDTSVPPWVFGFLAAPSGMFYWGVCGILIPFLLRKQGVPVGEISGIVAIASLPNIWSFVTSPVIDLGLSRRTWALLFASLTGLSAWVAIRWTAGSATVITATLFAGGMTQVMVGSAAGALMSTVRPGQRGRAGGWFQAGNIGAGSLAGGGLIWLSDRVSLEVLALASAAMILLPALAVLRVQETPLPRLAPKALFAAFFADVWLVLSARRTWLGFVFFCSPAGTGALANLISSVGPDYHASGDLVAFITGPGGAVLMGVGSAIGGWICDRVHRKTCYAVFGICSAACVVYLWLGPATAFTYGAGYAAYSFSIGLNFAAYAALLLEVLGRRERGAATAYAVLQSSGNIPTTYMTWLDGLGYQYGGARGLMMTEALVGGIGAISLLLIARHTLRRWPHLTDVPVPSAAERTTQ